MGKGIALSAAFAYTFYRSYLAFLFMLPVGVCYPLYEKKKLLEKRRQLLETQFKESMMSLASSFSAGYAMENALANSREELAALYGEDGLITREFTHMLKQLRMNQTAEQVLTEFAVRSGLEDIQNFAEIFSVAKRSGGDLSGIMRHTAEVIRDKIQVKEEIRTLTASKQLEQKIMNAIPFFMVLYVEQASPGFFDQMYGTLFGRCLMTGCMVAYGIAAILSKRTLEIEV